MTRTGAAPTGEPPEISIVVPLYNEAESLRPVLDELFEFISGATAPATCEVIIVDDGSTDDSPALLAALLAGRKDAAVVRHERNLGMGAAYTTGIRHSRGRFVYLHPADGSFESKDLAGFHSLAAEGKMVIGRRLGYRRTHSPWRDILSEVQRRLFGSRLGLELRDFCGVNLLPAAPLREEPPRSRTHAATIEAVVGLQRRGWIAVDRPIRIRPRLAGRSKILTWRGLVKATLDMVFLVARSRPGRSEVRK